LLLVCSPNYTDVLVALEEITIGRLVLNNQRRVGCFFEVDDLFPSLLLDKGIPNVPFVGHTPIEDFGTGWDFVDFQRDEFAYDCQCLAHAIAGDAPANWEEVVDKLIYFLTDVIV